MQGQSSASQGTAAERLFAAIVNQAILDISEHGEEAQDAERWLLSKDFEALQRLFHGVAGVGAQLCSAPGAFWPADPVPSRTRHWTKGTEKCCVAVVF
jgi:hypothetical protein